MASEDPRIDAYIAKSADFARPILHYLRSIVHSACPDTEETMKWSRPHFMYRDRLMCGMAAFKEHVALSFWLGSRIGATGDEGKAMGQFGRITSVADLPPKKVLTGFIKDAMGLNETRETPLAGIASARVRKPPAVVPDDLAEALRQDATARATFERFSPSNRREYIDWIGEAKRDETRRKRLQTTIEWLGEGKVRNWKYADC